MGLPQVVLPRFDAAAMLEAVHRHQVTATFTVPGMLTRLADLLHDSGDSRPLPRRHILYVYLAGRIDNMINTGSYHIYPGEVEEAIAGHTDVDQVRVVGEPDPIWGQAVTAYVVPARSAAPDLVANLHDQLAKRLARYKLPRKIHIVDHIAST